MPLIDGEQFDVEDEGGEGVAEQLNQSSLVEVRSVKQPNTTP